MANLLRRLRSGRQNSRGGIPAADLSFIPAWVQSGRVRDAEGQLRAVLAHCPDNIDALHYLGLVCHQTGRHAEAVAHIRAALALAPDANNTAALRANLAEALRAAGELGAAEAEARAALAQDRHQSAVRFNLATILAEQQRPAEALEHALQALATNENWPEALLLCASLYIALDQRAIALSYLHRARHLRPEDPALLVLSLRNRAWLCDWACDIHGDSHGDDSAFMAMLERWATRPADRAFGELNPFVVYEYAVPQSLRDAVTQAYADGVRMAAGAPPALAWEPRTNARLRIAYVSADFHNHPTMHLMRGLFARHDRTRFEISAYSLGPDDGSPYRHEVVRSVDRFVDIRAESAATAAERIRGDRIDILIDLKGYTHDARPELFARRAAPLQVAWLGYPASTGHGINDYMIVDGVVAPASHRAHYGEELVWMPHSYQVNDCEQIIASETPSRETLGLPADGFVFCCFNHVYKIEPRMFGVWMRILKRVPGSVLWLYATCAEARANLQAAAAAAGIDARRLVFAHTLPKPQHLARLRCADLFLDTLWINAHTSASDALWAGLPVLTCPQESFASRVGASLVHAVGLPELICADLRGYEDRAVQLATELEELRALRAHLAEEHARLPLFDTARFTRNLERAFEMMWDRHATGLPPLAFAVPEP